MTIFSKLFLLLLITFITGCVSPTTQRISVSESATKIEQSKQFDLAAQQLVENQSRLVRIFTQLSTKATPFCKDHLGPNLGGYFAIKQKGDIGDAMVRLYGVEEQPTLLYIVKGGAIDRAGLQIKDVMLDINGISTKDKKAIAKLYVTISHEDPIAMTIKRGEQTLAIKVIPDIGCRYLTNVSPDQTINAFADGKQIVINTGMMNFAQDDNQLALVVAHELAHNTMLHIEAKQKNAALGSIADLAVVILTKGQSQTQLGAMGAKAYSQEFEAEADYVGLYIMANAGLPIKDAPQFWRKMASAHPSSIRTNHAASHPSTAYRMLALEEAVKEIEGKIIAKQPLSPNMKDGKPSILIPDNPSQDKKE